MTNSLKDRLVADLREYLTANIFDGTDGGVEGAVLVSTLLDDITEMTIEWLFSNKMGTEEAVKQARSQGCICPCFHDTGGFRIADLTCPLHGIGGSEEGDGAWS